MQRFRKRKRRSSDRFLGAQLSNQTVTKTEEEMITTGGEGERENSDDGSDNFETFHFYSFLVFDT
ncbi:predicted protein [Arabidopsis lyrata subsp. lyrata]|uniref:Predicted protein n=1 Tax=Arabidopsis lyrata subsp. lyrata TaxID=81972 RepID=D7M9S3_ARALL|nr:predicted protein [Arabidopsis lyrata subsp. lyrata]